MRTVARRKGRGWNLNHAKLSGHHEPWDSFLARNEMRYIKRRAKVIKLDQIQIRPIDKDSKPNMRRILFPGNPGNLTNKRSDCV